VIVYRELSTLAGDLGVSGRTLYAVSNSLPKHYRTVELPKGDGAVRRLSIPDRELMEIQRRILNRLLVYMPVSPYAAAYRRGVDHAAGARPHIGRPVLLRLDIRHFFDSILYSDVKEYAFPAHIYAEPLRVLLSILCYCGDALPQGAPTSPVVSNLVLRDFDLETGAWCSARGISYTRYCDDMAFSGAFDPVEVSRLIAGKLRERGFFLNEEKTRAMFAGQRQTVTGLVVNERLNLPREYRRALRQELYFCRRFGVSAHLARTGAAPEPEACLRSLLGRVSYVLQISPENREMLGYREWLLQELALLHSGERDS